METHVDLIGLQRPVMALYPEAELGGDGSNWTGPNPAGVTALLHMAGFQSSSMLSVLGPPPPSDPEVVCSGRAVFHAYK